jgi:Primosomal protein N' (replication factor Y) - superfamily II helicase
MELSLKIALPGGRVERIKADFPYEGSPVGFRVLVDGKTGLVVGISDDGQVKEVVFPDKVPLTSEKNLSALQDTAMLYGLIPWLLLWELLPAEWNWKKERFLKVSLSSFVGLDQRTGRFLDWVAKNKRVREETAKKRFGWQFVRLLLEKGFLKVVEDWSAVNVEMELFSLNLPFDVALSKLRKTKSYAERVRLLSYLRERLYATREELREEGFSSQDLQFLVSKGIVKVEKELMQNFALNPRSQLRQGSVSLIKSVQKPVLVVGSLSKLLEHLVLLVESALSENKSLPIFCFQNSTLLYLMRELKPLFGDRVVSLSSFDSPRQFVKNWFLAQEEGRVILSSRLGLLVPFKEPFAFVLFEDQNTKLSNGIDLRNYLFHLYRYYGSQFFYYTTSLGVDTYQKVKIGAWELESLGYSASVKILKRKPEEVFSQELLSKLEDASLLLIRKTGYSYAYCPKCQFLTECPQCGTFLTLSKSQNSLFCTRCKWYGPPTCPHCEGPVVPQGFGVERAVEELEKYGLVKESLHFDTKPSLSGTYKKVFLVHGDNLLSLPNFNAEEEFYKYVRRAWAMAEQEFYLQTFLEEELVERYLRDDFLEEELEKRREENLPPFTKLILAVFPKGREKVLRELPFAKMRTYGNLLEVFLKVEPKGLREFLPKLISLNPLKLELW